MKILSLIVVLCFITGSAIAADSKQLLFDMAKKIAETKQYSVTIHMDMMLYKSPDKKLSSAKYVK